MMARNTTDKNPSAGGNIGGCYNGGPLISKTRATNMHVHAPVPHGPENCVRCRWFVSDATYLPQLISHLNFLSYRASEAANLAISLESEIEALNEKRFVEETKGTPFTSHIELDRFQRRYEKQIVEANLYTEDWVSCFLLINRIRNIEKNRGDKDNNRKIIAVGNERDLKVCITETNSKLLQLAMLCEDAEYYPDLKDEVLKTGVISERTIAISHFMRKKGYQPAALSMDQETQHISINAMLRKMALMMDKDNKIEGYRKAIDYLEMEEFMTNPEILDEGIRSLSQVCDDHPIKLTWETGCLGQVQTSAHLEY